MSELLENSLKKAEKGRAYWLKFIEVYDLSVGKYVILIPDSYTCDAYLSLLFLEDFIQEKNAESIIILCTESIIKEVAFSFSEKIEQVIIIDQEIKESLLKFYCLYEFSNRLIIASLTQPKGRRGKGLIQTGKVCYAEIFAVIVYGLTEIKKKEPPKLDKEKKVWIEQNSKMIWQIKQEDSNGN